MYTYDGTICQVETSLQKLCLSLIKYHVCLKTNFQGGWVAGYFDDDYPLLHLTTWIGPPRRHSVYRLGVKSLFMVMIRALLHQMKAGCVRWHWRQ
mmetsp:Transcript_21039/g.44863  ORF Transcript_21039/g.44863 Transcript_21039/m.44863 type:complete len:95 (+) Transcript_21039:453-737(+)